MYLRFISVVFSLVLMAGISFGQEILPKDPKSERVVFTGSRTVEMKSKKKIVMVMKDWVSEALPYPPMVFSVIRASKDTLMVKAVTEVPSRNGLHPISFRLILVPHKKSFYFRASEFYFEDIKLSLEKWLEKFSESTNKRHKRNVEMISQGIDSHIFLSMKELVSSINKK